jgi:Ni/Fe-hydrogenase subunit HybB-like protein
MPKTAERYAAFRPRFAFVPAGVAVVMFILISLLPAYASFNTPNIQTLLWAVFALGLLGVLVSVTMWLKANPVNAAVIAAVCVVIGMWLERWNIVVGTTTHAMLIPYITYVPSLTEIAITVASLALFVLMFILFFKIFPSISIWEVEEGRYVEEHASHTLAGAKASEVH